MSSEMQRVVRSEIDGQILINGDAIRVLEQHVEDESIDLVFIDPPYNLGKREFCDSWESEDDYLSWCYSWLGLCIRKLKPTGSLYLMNSTQNMPFLDLFLRDKVSILSRIVWTYDSSGVQARKHFGSLYEPILFAVKDKRSYVFNADEIKVEAKTGSRRKLIDYRRNPPSPYNSTKVPGNVWNFPRVRFRMPEYRDHPAQKPEVLLDRIIRASSRPGDLILDPFAGTFTTAFVASRLQRRSISIELEPRFYEIGMGRLSLIENPQVFAGHD